MPDYSALLQELRTVIGATWPETLPANDGGGIHGGLDAQGLPFGPWAAADQLPLAVIDLSGLQPSPAWSGLDGRVHEGPVLIYYVMRDDELAAALDAPLQALADALWDTGLTEAEVLEDAAPSTSARLPLNTLFRNAKYPLQCGAVTTRLLFG